MGMMSEFKEFAMKGNVVDLAIGVIIGTAFGKIVTASGKRRDHAVHRQHDWRRQFQRSGLYIGAGSDRCRRQGNRTCGGVGAVRRLSSRPSSISPSSPSYCLL